MMTLPDWLALVVPIIVLVLAAIIRHLMAELGKARATVEAQRETINTMKLQALRNDITAELQLKFLRLLPNADSTEH